MFNSNYFLTKSFRWYTHSQFSCFSSFQIISLKFLCVKMGKLTHTPTDTHTHTHTHPHRPPHTHTDTHRVGALTDKKTHTYISRLKKVEFPQSVFNLQWWFPALFSIHIKNHIILVCWRKVYVYWNHSCLSSKLLYDYKISVCWNLFFPSNLAQFIKYLTNHCIPVLLGTVLI
jgi:hypothetical protein